MSLTKSAIWHSRDSISRRDGGNVKWLSSRIGKFGKTLHRHGGAANTYTRSRVKERDTFATAPLHKMHKQCALLDATVISLNGADQSKWPVEVGLQISNFMSHFSPDDLNRVVFVGPFAATERRSPTEAACLHCFGNRFSCHPPVVAARVHGVRVASRVRGIPAALATPSSRNPCNSCFGSAPPAPADRSEQKNMWDVKCRRVRNLMVPNLV